MIGTQKLCSKNPSIVYRHYTTPQHFNTSKLGGLNYAAAESSYQPLPKERPELALHVNQNHQHQQDQQLQIQVQLQQHQQKQQTATPSHQQQQQSQQQQHQGLLSPGLSFAGNGEFFENRFYALHNSLNLSIIKLIRVQLRYRINMIFSRVYIIMLCPYIFDRDLLI